MDENIESLFIKSLVLELIKNSKPKEAEIHKGQIILEDYKPKKEIENIKIPKKKSVELPDLPNLPEVPDLPALPLDKETNMPLTSTNTQFLSGKTPKEKIMMFLKDPAVMGIECPGAGKYLLINRSGLIKSSPVTLSKEEIDSVMEQISNETKIPLTTGFFKAVAGNLIISATISKNVGTRFIMQKRLPF